MEFYITKCIKLIGGSWCSFSYSVGGYAFDKSTGTGSFKFNGGGQQCGRPEGSHGPVLIEGVLEELDMPSEFHFDPQTKLLTLWHNATSGSAKTALMNNFQSCFALF